MLLTAQQIRKQFLISNPNRTTYSLEAIHHAANQLGYKMKSIGGKKGYDSSLYTALSRHRDLLSNYDKNKSLQPKYVVPNGKSRNTNTDNEYQMFNGEPDRKDYIWETINKYINDIIEGNK